MSKLGLRTRLAVMANSTEKHKEKIKEKKEEVTISQEELECLGVLVSLKKERDTNGR